MGGAARKGEGKVNSLIGMSAIPQTYLTPKSWEPLPKSDTFQSGGKILWQWRLVIFANPSPTLLFFRLEFLQSPSFNLGQKLSLHLLYSPGAGSGLVQCYNSLDHLYWYFLYKLRSIDCSRNQKQKPSEWQILQRKWDFK